MFINVADLFLLQYGKNVFSVDLLICNSILSAYGYAFVILAGFFI